jgi:hypothetical protein
MSFSPFDVLMGMADNEERTLSSNANSNNTNTDYSSTERNSEEWIPSSQNSVGIQSFDDTMTLDSSTLQDFGSAISLPAGTIAGILQSQYYGEGPQTGDDGTYGGQTIVSSEPSGAFIPPPVASRDSWAISPHPGFVAESTLSLSTHCTDSLTFPNDRGICKLSPAIANENDGASDENDNDHSSEYDDDDDDEKKELLDIVEPPTNLLPIPPAPLKNHIDDSFEEDCSYCAKEHLPENFICNICKDVIVGALSLSCGCVSSTVCSSCWEAKTSFSPEVSAEKMGYVWVDKNISPICPSCSTNIKSTLYCHALDVAIFQIILNLPVKDDKARSLKKSYFSRLEVWRCIVMERNERRTRDEATRRDELLARLLQEEETFFHDDTIKYKSKARTTDQAGSLFFWGQAAVALAVALVVATIAPRAMNRR